MSLDCMYYTNTYIYIYMSTHILLYNFLFYLFYTHYSYFYDFGNFFLGELSFGGRWAPKLAKDPYKYSN